MIESLACGTPVIANLNGSTPEIIENGKNGFVVRDIDSAVSAIQHISSLSRDHCRESFERHFTADHMAENYLKAYEILIEQRMAARSS